MANTVFTYGKSGIGGAINLATDTIKAALLMSNNNAAATEDAQFLTNLTLDECNGSGYARITLTTPTVTPDTTNNKGVWDMDNIIFVLVGTSTRTVTGILIYKHVGADSANIPIAYIDTATGLPITPNGSSITVSIAAGGLITIG
jgi:hypothetical protein